MKLKIIKMTSKFGNFFIAKIDGKRLEKLSRVDVRQLFNEHDSTGLQRKIFRAKVINIAEFIDTSYSIFPGSLILMVNRKVKFNILEDEIEINENEEKLFTILDGQHRIAAFAESKNSFDVVVSIFHDLPQFKMVELFKVVNTTQSPINPNLADELEVELPIMTPEKFSILVIKRLNYDVNSPFHNKIKMYGEMNEDYQNPKTLSLHQFHIELVDKLYRSVKYYHTLKDILFTSDSFESSIEKIENIILPNEKKYIFWKYYKIESIERTCNIINTYFSVISDLLPIDWNSDDSLIFKTVGFRALMRILEDTYEYAIKIRSFKYDDIYKLLEPLKKIDGTLNSEVYKGSSYSLATYIYNDLYKLIKW